MRNTSKNNARRSWKDYYRPKSILFKVATGLTCVVVGGASAGAALFFGAPAAVVFVVAMPAAIAGSLLVASAASDSKRNSINLHQSLQKQFSETEITAIYKKSGATYKGVLEGADWSIEQAFVATKTAAMASIPSIPGTLPINIDPDTFYVFGSPISATTGGRLVACVSASGLYFSLDALRDINRHQNRVVAEADKLAARLNSAANSASSNAAQSNSNTPTNSASASSASTAVVPYYAANSAGATFEDAEEPRGFANRKKKHRDKK